MEPAPVEQIEHETPFILDIIIENVLDGTNLSDADMDYFSSFAKLWVRWQYANTKRFRRKMIEADRQFVEDFIAHWLNAFSKNPEQFRELHPANALV